MNETTNVIDYKIIAEILGAGTSNNVINYEFIDFSSYDTFILSLMQTGRSIIIKQIEEEVGINSNYEVEFTNSIEIDDNLNKIVSVDYEQVIFDNIPSLKRIEL